MNDLVLFLALIGIGYELKMIRRAIEGRFNNLPRAAK